MRVELPPFLTFDSTFFAMNSPSIASRSVRQTVIVAALMMALTTVTTLLSSGCRSAPISGRRQVVAIPEAQEISMGLTAYEETLAEEPMSEEEPASAASPPRINSAGRM